MSEYLAAQRYAKALSEAIADDSELHGALQWLQAFSAVVTQHADLLSALSNRSIRLSERMAVLDELLSKAEADPRLSNFVRELLRRGRIRNIEEVARVFRRRVDERLNRTTAQVTTVRPIGEQQTERLRAALSQYTGKSVEIKTKVDPDIVGGVVVKVDGTVIDGSLKARLKLLRDALVAEEN